MFPPATPKPGAETRGAPSRRIHRSAPALPGSASTAGRSWRATAYRVPAPAPACWDKPLPTYPDSLYPSSRRFRPESLTRNAASALPMAGVAARNVLYPPHVILRLERITQLNLTGVLRSVRQHHGARRRRLLLIHVEYLVARPQKLFR